jgi:hypothetical protein
VSFSGLCLQFNHITHRHCRDCLYALWVMFLMLHWYCTSMALTHELLVNWCWIDQRIGIWVVITEQWGYLKLR